jgi:hypothetical protein
VGLRDGSRDRGKQSRERLKAGRDSAGAPRGNVHHVLIPEVSDETTLGNAQQMGVEGGPRVDEE